MKILTAQINPIVGDLDYNTALITQFIKQGQELQADIVLFPELALTGYPPQDLLLHPEFMDVVSQSLLKIIAATTQITVVVGLPRYDSNLSKKKLFNSAALIQYDHHY